MPASPLGDRSGGSVHAARPRSGQTGKQCALSARCGRDRVAPVRYTEGQWRIGWQPIRPVLKHGPRSLTCARVTGLYETRRRNESEGLPSAVDSGRIPGLGVRAHYRPLWVLHHGGPRGSESVHVGTRKMVNYA